MAIPDATLAQAFERQSHKYGARALLKDKRHKAWRDHSWSEIADRVMRLRTGLIRLGIKPGNRVAILAENSPEWVIVDQALLGLGRNRGAALYDQRGGRDATRDQRFWRAAARGRE